MTTVTLSGGPIGVTFKMSGMDKAVQTTERLQTRTKSALSETLEDLAQRSTTAVQDAVANPTVASLSPLSARKRAIGKTQGAIWPPIPTYGPKPLYRSGALARAIDYAKEDVLRFVVGVAEGAKSEFSGGKYITLDQIAALIETGFTRTVPLTLRMLVYIKVLLGQITKQPTEHIRTNKGLGRTLTAWVPARPVWTTTFDRIEDSALKFVDDAWFARMGL